MLPVRNLLKCGNSVCWTCFLWGMPRCVCVCGGCIGVCMCVCGAYPVRLVMVPRVMGCLIWARGSTTVRLGSGVSRGFPMLLLVKLLYESWLLSLAARHTCRKLAKTIPTGQLLNKECRNKDLREMFWFILEEKGTNKQSQMNAGNL